MGIDCGTQIVLCDLPIHIDTYQNCSHACKYCFVKRKHGIVEVEPKNCTSELVNFIKGRRSVTTNWCDWKIPLHWGAMSDPFQPAEKQFKCSLELLKVFADTGYPFVVSTKGKLITEEPYIGLIEKCNCVVQISAVCSLYDKLETGAPSYLERLEMMRVLSKKAKRVIVRIQPYIREALPQVLNNIPKLAEAGVYGIVVEGMKYINKRDGLIKVGGDWCYKTEHLRADFVRIRDCAHSVGMRFFCGENRLRSMGDDACCCGIEGLDGFVPNRFNAYHIMKGDAPQPTEAMKCGSCNCFRALYQNANSSIELKLNKFASMMVRETRKIIAKGTLG